MPYKANSPAFDYILSRHSEDDRYRVWRVDVSGEPFLQSIPVANTARFDHTHQIVSIGDYLLEWGPLAFKSYQPCYPYRLFQFDPASPDPLAGRTVQKGLWPKTKFWRYRADFGNPAGANKNFQTGDELSLLPMGTFLLNVIPTADRGTFQLWNFDPALQPMHSADPLPSPYTPQGSFETVCAGHELIPIGNFVLDRVPESRDYWLWSFDPQSAVPFSHPALQRGRWRDIDANHRLLALGDYVLDWMPADRSYRLWRFDPTSVNPLNGPARSGILPAEIDAQTTLVAVQTRIPVDQAQSEVPGTVDFMRSKIKHVVYLMLENRSFDHICGWLYSKNDSIKFVGHEGPFEGASLDMFNIDPAGKGADERAYLNIYKEGKLSDDWDLDFLKDDPYHDYSDVLRQYFRGVPDGYRERATPNMGGFVSNNGTRAVMSTYAPEQLPVLTGLAREYAVSDEWFSSMPGPTDPNRAFAFTGSALRELNNFQNDNEYLYWPYTPRRQSIWKVLWCNGFTDWKLYNSVEWQHFVHTYHLFLQGQIPWVDQNISNYISGIDEFKKGARAGNLPAFSFLEPIWISLAGTSSYHPGGDLIPGERALNEIYEALKSGPAWNETLLIITFDEHGGLFDHVPPPYAQNPWPNDEDEGFRYDLMGVRVPAILVSPLIEQHTVFRSSTAVSYDSTSILATLLQWYGIPKSRWGLGQRTHNAPTFENVFTRREPRANAPSFTPPYDKTFPREGGGGHDVPVHHLHRLMTPWLVSTLVGKRLTVEETARITQDILHGAQDLKTLHKLIDQVSKQAGA